MPFASGRSNPRSSRSRICRRGGALWSTAPSGLERWPWAGGILVPGWRRPSAGPSTWGGGG
eukprot:11207025-Lingulodinium_polyedra.AAC.1